MTNKKISNYTELQTAINELNAGKLKQEELMKKNIGEIKDNLNPLVLLKNYLKHVAGDNELHQMSLKAAISIGAKFIIEKLLGSNKNVKRHFAATIFENILSGFAK
jgi:hypothetical protein